MRPEWTLMPCFQVSVYLSEARTHLLMVRGSLPSPLQHVMLCIQTNLDSSERQRAVMSPRNAQCVSAVRAVRRSLLS